MKKNFQILSMLTPIQEAIDELEKHGEIEVGTSLTRKEVLDRIINFDAVLADDEFSYDEEFFKRTDQLKIVSRVGAGYENIDLSAATEHQVMVTNTPGVMAESVAEHTIMLMLASANNLIPADRDVKIALITAVARSTLARMADEILEVKEIEDDRGDNGTQKYTQPLGSPFEQALFIILESLVSHLMKQKKITEKEMANRHANLE